MSNTDRPKPDSVGAKEQPWELRTWHGMSGTAMARLLARNRFAVSPSRIGMTMILVPVSWVNSSLWLVQSLVHGRRIARTRLADDPIFVLGHWRSGTTLLHELLAADPRHTYPNTYACFCPNHFVLTGRLLPWCLKLLLPPMRPMDNMPVTWQHPQEDEWAMCNMGMPSPYLSLAFANRPPQFPEYLDLRGVPPRDLERWKAQLLWFLKCVSVREPKRIVLKSPQHTCRIRVLAEMFPNARFVHIVRHPYALYPSTLKTWRRMSKYHGLQVPRFEGLEESIFSTFERMYRVFEEDIRQLDRSRLCEIRYEDLVPDLVGRMRGIYEQLGLGDFEPARPAIEQYAARTAGYKPGRYELDEETRREIDRRWGGYMRKYGYASQGENA